MNNKQESEKHDARSLETVIEDAILRGTVLAKKAWAWLVEDARISEVDYMTLARWALWIGVPAHSFYLWFLYTQIHFKESLPMRGSCMVACVIFFALARNKTYREKYLSLHRYLWILFMSFQFIVLPYHLYNINNYDIYWLASFAVFAMALVLFLRGIDIVIAGFIGIVFCELVMRNADEPANKHKMVLAYINACILLSSYAMLYIRSMQKSLMSKIKATEDAYAQLRIYDMKKDDFVASVVHEIRTPLSVALVGMDEIFIIGPQSDPGFVKYYDLVTASLHSVRSQINDLVEMERVSRGKFELASEIIRIDDWLPAISDRLSALCGIKSMNFRCLLSTPGLVCVFDPLRIECVLSNLVNNAVKFTEANGNIEVLVGVDSFGCLFFEVSDTGCGIDAVDIPYIFDKYYQASKHQGNALGIGIGLSLVKLIVTSHGGKISLRTAPGRGTSFKITLGEIDPPITDLDSVRVSILVDTTKKRLYEIPDNYYPALGVCGCVGKLIYVVEDSDTLCAVLRDHLASRGFNVAAFRSPLHVLDRLASKSVAPPSMILTDMNMPHMSGFDMMLKIREDVRFTHIPFIFVTAHTKIHDILAGHASTYIVEKPFVYADIDTLVDRSLLC